MYRISLSLFSKGLTKEWPFYPFYKLNFRGVCVPPSIQFEVLDMDIYLINQMNALTRKEDLTGRFFIYCNF